MGNHDEDRERWDRVKEIFLAAQTVAASERDAFVVARCGGDEDMLAEIRELLSLVDECPQDFIDPPFETDGGTAPQQSLNLLGHRLGDFLIEEEIGRGAMGVVYRARQLSLGRDVAVKVLPHTHRRRSEAIRRFQREAAAVSKLNHPNIVQVFSSGEHNGVCYYAMEWVDGRSLAQILDQQREDASEVSGPVDLRDPMQCADLVAGIARALAHAHSQGIIHRDIKPANILIDRAGQPRVVDFGLAKDERLQSLSTAGAVVGTPYYMSPEQAQTHLNAVDHRTDVYSLGAVLYELLTLAHPFEGESSLEIFYKITHDKPQPILSIRPSIPKDLARICMKTLERSPDHRFATADELADRIDDFRSHRQVHLRSKPFRDRVRGYTRSPWFATVATAVVLLLVLITWTATAASSSNLRAATLAALHFDIAGGGEAAVRALRLQQGDVPGDWQDLGRTVGGTLAIRLDPGSYRFQVDAGSAGAADLRRDITAGSMTRVTAHPATVGAVSEGMARIPAGDQVISIRPGRGKPLTTRTVRLASYWIDRRPVTIREFLAFLDASDHMARSEWGPARMVADGRLTADMLDRPAVAVDLDAARAYAEWQGKRLPTLAEWQRAMQVQPEGWWREARTATDLSRRFAFDLPATVAKPDGSPSTALAFLKFARSVPPLTEVGYGPYGMLQPFGNVAEWTSTESELRANYYILGWSWRYPKNRLSDSTMQDKLVSPGASFDLGFRCVKSAGRDE